MAVISFLLGSVLGSIGALLGWALLDANALTAFGYYIAASLSFGLIFCAAFMGRSGPEDMQGPS